MILSNHLIKIKVQRNVAIGVTACLLLITICLFVK